jgi:hypothetical protein
VHCCWLSVYALINDVILFIYFLFLHLAVPLGSVRGTLGYRVTSVGNHWCIRTIPTKLMIWRWPSQNTYGIWPYYTEHGLRVHSSASTNVWRLAEDILNITCHFLYCNHQVHRDFLINLYNTLRVPTGCVVLSEQDTLNLHHNRMVWRTLCSKRLTYNDNHNKDTRQIIYTCLMQT